MILYKNTRPLNNYLEKRRAEKQKIGFVPTMGALHEGHMSLIAESRNKADVTVCSIFVNPTQFNNPEDLEKYPVTLENDIFLLENAGCDVLFLAKQQEVYPTEESKQKHFDIGYLENILEGKFRPGHFQGVCMVVDRLLDMVQPDFLFLGQKDFQQCLVIKKLLSLNDSNVTPVICPIVREKSGLAMSSRNLRLTDEERKTAAALFQALNCINNSKDKDFISLRNESLARLADKGFKVEYLELADRNTLEAEPTFNENIEQILLIAAWLGKIRLIDNLFVNR